MLGMYLVYDEQKECFIVTENISDDSVKEVLGISITEMNYLKDISKEDLTQLKEILGDHIILKILGYDIESSGVLAGFEFPEEDNEEMFTTSSKIDDDIDITKNIGYQIEGGFNYGNQR